MNRGVLLSELIPDESISLATKTRRDRLDIMLALAYFYTRTRVCLGSAWE